MSNHRKARNFSAAVYERLKVSPVDIVFGFNKMPGLDIYYAADSCFEDKARKYRGFLYRLTSRYRDYAAYEKAVFGPDSSTFILLISEIEKQKFMEHYDTPENRMYMLPPGISRDRCRPGNAGEIRLVKRHELGIGEYEYILLFVGSGFRKKGLDRAIKALASLPQELASKTRLVVAGKDREARFRRLANRIGVADKLMFLGGRDDIPDLLLMADMLVHPAIDEAAGIVLLEAIVAGLPVLVTDVCGYAHHIQLARAGKVLSSPFSQEELNQSLLVLADQSSLQEWQHNAITYAKQADLFSMHETGIDCLEALHHQQA